MSEKPSNTHPIYRVCVDAAGEPKFVGRPSLDKAALRSWLPFVKQAWHSRSARVVHVADLLPNAATAERA